MKHNGICETCSDKNICTVWECEVFRDDTGQVADCRHYKNKITEEAHNMILKCRKCEKQFKCPARSDIKDDCKKFKAIDKKYLVSVVSLETRETEKFFTNRKPQAPFAEPSRDEVQAYCDEKNLRNVDADEFINYYSAYGWKTGNRQMKDWKAAARNWDKRQQRFDKEKQSKTTKDNISGVYDYSLEFSKMKEKAKNNTEIRY